MGAWERLADLLCTRRRAVLACTLAVLAAAGWGAATVVPRFSAGAQAFFGQDSPSIRAIGAVVRARGVWYEASAVALAPAGRLPVVVRAMRAEPVVARVRTMRSRDGREAYAAAFFAAGGAHGRDAVVDRLRARLRAIPGVTFGDFQRAYDDVDHQVSSDLPRIEAVAVPLLLVLSFVVFRSLVAAALPIMVSSIAVALTLLGLRGLVEVTPISSFALNLSTGLGLGLAIDYALLMVSRYREEMVRHGPGRAALVPTLATAGRTVVFSASTVAGSLLCLLVLPLAGLRSMAAAGAMVAICAAAAAILPMSALLAVLGERVNALAPARLQRSASRAARPTTSGGWYRVAHAVMRRPLLVTVACVAALLAAGLPARGATLGLSDLRSLPPSHPTAQVATAIDSRFAGDLADPILALPGRGADPGAVARYVARLRALPEALAVQRERGGVIDVVSRGLPHGPTSQRLVGRIEALRPPFRVALTGGAVINHDGQRRVGARLPLALLLLSLSTLAVLLAMTRSVLLPLKAVLMNAVTAAATLGLLVAAFQDGGLAPLLDFDTTHFLDQNTILLLLFLVLGLSTDYGVFLLARIKEVHDAGADNREAVARGLERSGRIVTAAALLFCVAVGSSGAAHVLVVKEFGIGAAAAVLIDATVVRVLLVPALMALLGEANWWAPRPLRPRRPPAEPAPSSAG